MSCAVTRALRTLEDKKNLQACAICGCSVKDKAMVGREEALCMGPQDETHGNCFAWFSGYPWVLFELGLLYSWLISYEHNGDTEVIRWR